MNRDEGDEATPVIRSKDITEAAQKRASEIVNRLGNDDLYDEDERDRARTVEDIIGSNTADEPVEKEKEQETTHAEAEAATPDESELVTEHVAVDPDLNDLYLEKAKITEKLLMGDITDDDDDDGLESSQEGNEETIPSGKEEVNDDETIKAQACVTEENEEMRTDMHSMDMSVEMEEEIFRSQGTNDDRKSPARGETEDTAQNCEVEDKSVTEVAGQDENDDDFDIRGGRQYRRKSHSESEEGEVSDTSEVSIDLTANKKDINEEITEDWNFLKNKQDSAEGKKEKYTVEIHKRSKKKRRKHGKHRHRRDRSNDSPKDESKNRKKGRNYDKEQSRKKDSDMDSKHDKKRRYEDQHEKERNSQEDDKAKRIRAKFEAPLFVNTLMKTATETANPDKEPHLFDAYHEGKSSTEMQKTLTETSAKDLIPKLDTNALREILAKVAKGNTGSQNVSNEDNAVTVGSQEYLHDQSTDANQHRRGDMPDQESEGCHSLLTARKSDFSAQEATELRLGTVELLARDRGLSIPGAESHERDEPKESVDTGHRNSEGHIPMETNPQSSAVKPQSQSSSEIRPPWERNRPIKHGMKRPPWEMKKQRNHEGVGEAGPTKPEIFPSTRDRKPRTEENNNATILFHGSGSQKTGKSRHSNHDLTSRAPWLNRSSRNIVSKSQMESVTERAVHEPNSHSKRNSADENSGKESAQDLSRKTPWQSKRMPSVSSIVQQNALAFQDNECSEQIADPWPQPSAPTTVWQNIPTSQENESSEHIPDPWPLENLAIKAPWLNKASRSSVPNFPATSIQGQEEDEEKNPPSENLQSLAMRAPWQRRTSQNSETQSVTGNDQPSNIAKFSGSEFNTVGDEPKKSDNGSMKLVRRTSIGEWGTTDSDLDQLGELKNPSKDNEIIPKPPHSTPGNSHVHYKRRRSSAECSSDASSITSSSPRSHVGHSPASSSGSMNQQDPERDREIFNRQRQDLIDEIDSLVKEIKKEKTDEKMQKYEEKKWQVYKITIDIEILDIDIHRRKEGNRYQVGIREEI